jgi:hypothetical protein
MKNQTPTSAHGVPDSFLCKFGREVTAVLSGFDRLRFRATLRLLFVPAKMEAYLSACHVLIKDFKTFAEVTTAKIKAAAYASAQSAGRPAAICPAPRSPRRTKPARSPAPTAHRRTYRPLQRHRTVSVVLRARRPEDQMSGYGDAQSLSKKLDTHTRAHSLSRVPSFLTAVLFA